MALSIKTKEAHDLAAELSRKMGISMTEAVTIALREKLSELQLNSESDKKRADLMEYIRETQAMVSPELKAASINELLYDDLGMPK